MRLVSSESTPPWAPRSGAERYDSQRAARAQFQQRAQLIVRRGVGDRVRRAVGLAGTQAHEVRVALAGGVQHPLGMPVAHVLRAHDAAQLRERRGRDPAGGELHVFERHRRSRPRRQAHALAQEAQRVRGQHRRVLGIAPAPPAHRRRRRRVSH
jgi:hypothetical protein